MFLVMVVALLFVTDQFPGPVDDYRDYLAGYSSAPVYVIEYNQAEDNYFKVNFTAQHDGRITLFLNGGQVWQVDTDCSGACSHTWSATEGVTVTLRIEFDRYVTGEQYFFRLAGRAGQHYPPRDPYHGVQHWSALPKIMYPESNVLSAMYNQMLAPLVNPFLETVIALFLVGLIVKIATRSIARAADGGATSGAGSKKGTKRKGARKSKEGTKSAEPD